MKKKTNKKYDRDITFLIIVIIILLLFIGKTTYDRMILQNNCEPTPQINYSQDMEIICTAYLDEDGLVNNECKQVFMLRGNKT